MTHAEVRAGLGDYLEGDLPLDRRALIDAHLDACPACAAHLATLRATVDALRALEDPEPPPGLAAAVLARIEAGEGRPSALARWLDLLPQALRTRIATPVLVLASAALVALWLRPGLPPTAPAPARPTLEEALGGRRLVGASSAPDAAADERPAGPRVPPDALDEALRDPESVVRATESLDEADRDAWLAGLAQQAGSRERTLAVAQALRGLRDPRGAVLADAFLRLAGAGGDR